MSLQVRFTLHRKKSAAEHRVSHHTFMDYENQLLLKLEGEENLKNSGERARLEARGGNVT